MAAGEDLFGEAAGQRRRLDGGPGCGGGEQAVDEQHELSCGFVRARVGQGEEFGLEEVVEALAVVAGDLVGGVVGISQREVGGQVAAAAEIGSVDHGGQGVEDGEDALVRVVAGGLHGGDTRFRRVRDGLTVEALGYSKTAGEVPLATGT